MPRIAGQRSAQTVSASQATPRATSTPSTQKRAPVGWSAPGSAGPQAPPAAAAAASHLRLGKLTGNGTDTGTYRFERGTVTLSRGKVTSYRLRDTFEKTDVSVPTAVVDRAVKEGLGAFKGLMESPSGRKAYVFERGGITG
ncbi:MAG: hypothetical protein JNG84_03885 [Archangium sp.]|nr:hypothetical protein [Archangium sp.]